jgi:hypothetical protein
MSDRERLLQDALSSPSPVISYALSAAVARQWPDQYVLETEDHEIDLDTFVARVPCEVVLHASPHPQLDTDWAGPLHGLQRRLVQGHRTVIWEGESFEVVQAAWADGMGMRSRTWVVGRHREGVERLATQVALVTTEVRDDEVMVFANGCWQRSQELRTAIRGSTFDNLVLPSGMAETLLQDFRQFLGARADYERLGVPWKRGVLLLGPPGNGKTHCIKALLNALGLSCLYVQSFEAPYTNPQRNVHAVFERARKTTPCALVLEDLDSLVTKTTRSFFLNELDGFAANTGIVTIATTNHAERLDTSILDRPSRFDRKYHFGLPALAERQEYLRLWNHTAKDEVRLSDPELQALAASTDGFSYAYLKELMVSSLVRWLSDARVLPLPAVAASQVAALRDQMSTLPPEPDTRTRYVDEWSSNDPSEWSPEEG